MFICQSSSLTEGDLERTGLPLRAPGEKDRSLDGDLDSDRPLLKSPSFDTTGDLPRGEMDLEWDLDTSLEWDRDLE
jgi:hypothetical protein